MKLALRALTGSKLRSNLRPPVGRGLPKLCVPDVSVSNGSTISSEKVLGLSL